MTNQGVNKSNFGIEDQGINQTKNQYWNLGTESLYEEALRRGEGTLARGGAFLTPRGYRSHQTGCCFGQEISGNQDYTQAMHPFGEDLGHCPWRHRHQGRGVRRPSHPFLNISG